MPKELVIFGLTELAEVAFYYFLNDTNYTVVAFTVDKDFMPEDDTFQGLPVVPFERVNELYPSSEYELFIAISYTKLNAVRKEKFIAAKQKGYTLASYISSRACILNDENIGENCFILENNVIQPFVTIEDNVTLWSGNHIGHHSTIHAHTFIASHAVISGGVSIGEQCFIGVNATLRDHITIGERCIVGAGALLLDNAEADGIYPVKATLRSKVPSTMLEKI